MNRYIEGPEGPVPIMFDHDDRARVVKAEACWMCGEESLPVDIRFGSDDYHCKGCDVKWRNPWSKEEG